MQKIRQIVSGNKARTSVPDDGPSGLNRGGETKNGEKQKKRDLDLIYLTDRMIIMGWPSSGIESTYRNPRKDVVHFLDSRHPSKYHIVNLCPLSENSYPSSDFHGPVTRLPLPDHFAPPLSLMRVASYRIGKWLEGEGKEQNIIVVHCKAGKGRSGTISLSYLLTQPNLPRPSFGPVPDLPLPETDPSSAFSPETVDERLRYLFAYHTSRRMRPGTSSQGVSISSQRRFLSYFARTLSGRDPRPKLAGKGQRIVKLEFIRIVGDGMMGIAKGVFGGSQVACQLRRYNDSVATLLRKTELEIEKGEEVGEISDELWRDQVNMLVRVGDVVQVFDRVHPPSYHVAEQGLEPKHRRVLYPGAQYLPPSFEEEPPFDDESAVYEIRKNGGAILLDADREVQMRFLIGETGRKHSKLPSMVSLAISWIVPSFEMTLPPESNELETVILRSDQLDFYKPQWAVDQIEVGLRWVSPTDLETGNERTAK
ncbi:phosphatases II [Meredithblackwellia eburnea MCA 4105]